MSAHAWGKHTSQILICWVTGILFPIFVQNHGFYKHDLVIAFLVLLLYLSGPTVMAAVINLSNQQEADPTSSYITSVIMS